MVLLGKGSSVFWNNITPELKDEYDHWHCFEHIPERVTVPGFLRGRRYFALKAERQYFNFYETENLATLTSLAYLERLNDPTPWTKEVLGGFRDLNRTLCDVVASHGTGEGAFILTAQFSIDPTQEDEIIEAVGNGLFADLVTRRGIVGAHLLRGDQASSKTETEEKALRDKPDEIADWVFLIEGIELDYLAELRDHDLSNGQLAARGIFNVHAGLYVLHMSLNTWELEAAAK